MAINFQYGGLPPAMQRSMERIGQAPSASPQSGMPEIPRSQGMMQMPEIPQMQGVGQMPQMPQMQGVPGMDMLQQYMPQNTNPYMNGSGTDDPTSMLQQFMPQGTDRAAYNTKNMSIIESQRLRAQQTHVGPGDVGRNSQGTGPAQTSKGLGSLSAKYESNGDPGTIANTKGDLGGASYGTYQLTTTSGHAKNFANSYGGALKGLKPGTTAFNNAWKAEAKKNPSAFANAQHKYIENNHYKPAANNIKKKTGFDTSKYPKAVQDAVWSIGVQHGAGGAASIFRNAGVKNGMSAEQVLRAVYGERMKTHIYFKSSPKNIQDSVRNRFQSELNQALKML